MTVGIQVLGIEVIQAIQSIEDPIELLADKRTAVRVYVRPQGLATSVPVTATLEVVQDRTPLDVQSSSPLELQGDDHHPDLETQRRSLERSLCFFLEPAQTVQGSVKLKLKKVTPTLRADRDIGLKVLDYKPVTAEFKKGPTLSVRLVCYRVRDPKTGAVHTPNAVHRLAVRSFLERAFPISKLQWSEITVEPPAALCPPYSDNGTTLADPGRTWQEKFDLACAHLMAIRARELESEQDPRTLYYGLVYHPTDFFVGATSDVPPDAPSPARFDVVAIGPAEERDGFYAGHEIAHMLGRLHPGIGEGQTREDAHFPEEYEGRLSSAEARHHGFDMGDATHPARVLPYDEWFDLMTYGEPVWVSAYTYRGLLVALQADSKESNAEDSKQVNLAEPAEGAEEERYLQVIGTYDLTKGAPKGTLAYVVPGKTGSPASPKEGGRVVVVGRDDAGHELFRANVELKHEAAADLARDTGAFHVTVEDQKELSALELVVDGRLVDVLEPRYPRRELTRLVKDQMTIRLAAGEQEIDLLTITWPEDYSRRFKHTVQVRKIKGGNSWRTVATGITAEISEVPLDRTELKPPVEVRILRAERFGNQQIYIAELELTR